MDNKLIRKYFESGDISSINTALKTYPEIKDKFIKFGFVNQHAVHPLHFACDCVFENKIDESTALEICKLYIAAGCDVNGNAKNLKDTPLIAAISLYCDSVAKLFIDHKANLSHHGTHGGTALHWAAWMGALSIAKILLAKGVNLDVKDNDFGATPIHWAINGITHFGEKQREQKQIIETLLQAGAKPEVVDNSNKTPYEIAENAALSDISGLIKKYLK
ncbi:ankyrin repeat domain-containing protein [Chondrinema litorale]|uniref:ankyrin repeat domain-containing protein n=1 Tax=Chondrinema litorale TaxID=2994555 RepID=UPI00254336D0|nr:ankyrin repeat domain-containing protein [Chondrinema litorale]UZR94734.1 ankyrin repeat domain-containing protein [Chondrinema litorale]